MKHQKRIEILEWLAQQMAEELAALKADIQMNFNPEKPVARIKSNPNPARVFVYDSLASGKPMTVKQLFDLAKAKGLKVTKHTINARANELADSLHIESVGHGKYRRVA
jgi:hypothetical protein